MIKIKMILAFLIVISVINIGLISYAQPKIPKATISSDIPADIRKQIEGLYSSNLVERAYAAARLGEMNARSYPAIQFLVGILGDGKPLNTLFMRDPPASLAALPSGSTTTPGLEAARALVKIGEYSVDPLIAVLIKKDEHFIARFNAAFALGKLKDPRAVKALTDTLTSHDYSTIRERSASSLGELKDSPELEHLISPLVKPFINALKDKEASERSIAAFVLGELKVRLAVENLISTLKDHNPSVRGKSAEALGKIKDNRAVKPLLMLFGDEKFSVRRSAIWSLGQIGDPRAIESLINIFEGEDYDLWEPTAEALKLITGIDFREDTLNKWKEWLEKNKGNLIKGR